MWQSLEQVHGLCAATPTWRRRLGNSFDLFAPSFMRRLEEKAESIWCEECYCAHAVVTHPDGKMVGVCECDPWNCDDMLLTTDDVALWEVNWTRLGRAVARAFDCEWQEAEFLLPRTRQIGTFGGVGLPVVLSVAHDRMEFRRSVAELSARLRDGFVLLAPTAAFVDVQSRELLSHSRAAFFDLASHVTLLPNGALRARRSGGDLFSPYITTRPEPVVEDVARAAFKLVAQLDAEEIVKMPSVLTVFRMYCVEELSADDIAARCRCAKGTVINRLRMIRGRTGKEPNELRRFATQFNQIEESARDTRAKHIHRKSLIHDGAEEDAE